MPVSAIASAIVSSIVSAMDPTASTTATTQPAVSAIVRPFPEATKVGDLEGAPMNGKVTISGQSFLLSPGVQIRNQMNLIVMPSTLGATSMPIRYQLDVTGLVWRIWILTPAEVAAANSSK